MKKCVFVIYLCLIIFLVIFKVWENPLERFNALRSWRDMGFDNVNLVPFYTVKTCLKYIDSCWAITNLIGNSIPFFLLGIISQWSCKERNRGEIFFSISALIMACEIMQYVLFLGVCDIDDVIINLLCLNFVICLIN